MNGTAIPHCWISTLLDEVIQKIVGGGTPSKSKPEYYQGNIPWMSVKDMNKHVLEDTADHISPEAVENSSTNVIPAGTPIIATRMSLGKVVVANFDSAINQDLKAVFLPPEINRDYFVYWYRSIAHTIERMGTGTTVKGIRLETLRGLGFMLPPLAEQKVIADKLDTLLAQVETTKTRLERIPKILKCFRQSVLAAAVSGRIDGSDISKWDKAQLIDIVHERPRNGRSPKGVSYETPYRNLTLSATTSGQFLAGNFKYIELDIGGDSYLWVKDGDILIQRANTLDYVGISALYRGPDNVYVYPDLMMKCTTNDRAIPEFLHLTLLSEPVRKYFRENATGTSGNMPKINQKTVSETPILLPSIDEQTQIVHRVSQLFTHADHIEQQVHAALERVNNLTQSILAKAFRGELTAQWRKDNPELISGENSAAALLERIKAERAAMQSAKKGQKTKMSS